MKKKIDTNRRNIRYFVALVWSIPWIAALGAIVFGRMFFSNMYVNELGEFVPWFVYVPQTIFLHSYLIFIAFLPFFLLLHFETKRDFGT